jgi:hypothetical protein
MACSVVLRQAHLVYDVIRLMGYTLPIKDDRLNKYVSRVVDHTLKGLVTELEDAARQELEEPISPEEREYREHENELGPIAELDPDYSEPRSAPIRETP